MSADNYILQVGNEGKERLTILNELFRKSSQALLLNAGLSLGKRVLEIGCGTGEMTCWIAEQVGATGHVYAVDISAEQLTIAKQFAAAKKLSNITFLQQSVFDLNEVPQVDLIYSRFIFMHLDKPFAALKIALSFLKPNGVIVCEEPTNSITCCYPPSPVFQRVRELLLSLGKAKGMDFDLGEKLFSYFCELNLKNIVTVFVQPIYQTKHDKLMVLLLLKEIKMNLIMNHLADENEIDALMKAVYQFIEDDQYLVSFARTTQIYAAIGNS